MTIDDDGYKSDSSPNRQVKVFKARRGTHDVSTAKKSLKVSPKKEPNTLQSIKSMHVNQRKYELDRIEKENLKIA